MLQETGTLDQVKWILQHGTYSASLLWFRDVLTATVWLILHRPSTLWFRLFVFNDLRDWFPELKGAQTSSEHGSDHAMIRARLRMKVAGNRAA